MKIGIFGGSFDPVHTGHLLLAEQCREQRELDKVFFVPATISPLKTSSPIASNKHRLAMLSLAIAGHREFEISEVEIERGGKSFTVDTLKQFQDAYPDDELFLMMGQDSVTSFAAWKSPAEILQMASPLIVRRPGNDQHDNMAAANLDALREFMPENAFEEAQKNAIESRLIDISSTDIRRRTAESKSIRYLLPRAVEKYIETNKLYLPKN